ncbi:hypothetical protein CAL7716_080200 [Calothrix sp. PCC 7716]|nr:hypothetical protein CAL7716_080200 [Calothrix sp. PCC 7716]
MGKKGYKSQKGVGDIWNEPKSERLSIRITPTGKELALERSQSEDISLSEVLERYGRNQIDVKLLTNDQLQGFLEQIILVDGFVILDEIYKLLPLFSSSELHQLINKINDTLHNRLIEDSQMEITIALLIQKEIEKRFYTVENLANAAHISVENILSILEGNSPEDDDIYALPSVLTKDDGSIYDATELLNLREKQFGNGSSNGKVMHQ